MANTLIGYTLGLYYAKNQGSKSWFLKSIFLYKPHGLRVLTPLTHAHILEDFCGYNTVIQYLESSADFSLKRSVDLIYNESP